MPRPCLVFLRQVEQMEGPHCVRIALSASCRHCARRFALSLIAGELRVAPLTGTLTQPCPGMTARAAPSGLSQPQGRVTVGQSVPSAAVMLGATASTVAMATQTTSKRGVSPPPARKRVKIEQPNPDVGE